ncbi:MAG: SDR family oxidoreductase [Bacteroidia bacterium]|nr:SDR family oxidoreductase [Bacteroidia bacterium]
MLQDKKIVIIGGTAGIGLSAAQHFIAKGAKVVAVGLGKAQAEEARRRLGEDGLIIQRDAREKECAAEAILICKDRFGGFDGLYHVAGGSGRKFGDGPLHEITPEGWAKTFELNLTSLMYSNQAAVRAFMETASSGSILNLSSVLAWSPSPKYFTTHAYATAKSAIIGFSKAIASFYAPHNIRVNVLAPALVATPMSERAQGNQEIMDFVSTKQVLDGGRIGKPEDLNGLAAYFMSEESRFTTGQVIAVDGAWDISEGQYGG